MSPPEPHRRALNRSPWIAPWRSLTPWWVMLAGVVLGQWIGMTPQLFLVMAATCLLLGVLNEDAGKS